MILLARSTLDLLRFNEHRKFNELEKVDLSKEIFGIIILT